MADEMLEALDAAFAHSRGKRLPRPGAVDPIVDDDADEPSADAADDRFAQWPWLEVFVGIQFLWGALLFVPGAQAYRPIVRALPYISSLALLAVYFLVRFHSAYPWGTRFLIGALGVLALNLLHSTTQLYAGIAQGIFQLAVVAPIFWACKAVHSPKRLERMLVLALVFNCASAALGLLQVYYPDQFMPPQFSAFGLQMNDAYVDSQTYMGRDGRVIVRPPGLTDMPGGAAVAGGFAAVLGLGLSLRSKRFAYLLATIAASGIGLAVIYLTQVRSVLLMVIGAVAILVAVAFRRGRTAAGAWIGLAGGALIVTSFLWASSVGGESVEQRFMNIRETGAVQTFQESRGHFLAFTVGELLDQYPLGAGLGRWGMMNAYFGDPTDLRSPPIYVEIQLTGWLLDGGVPMWFFYGGAILLSFMGVFRLSGSSDPAIAHAALTVLAVQALITGLAMAGPAFNTQLGIMFWLCVGALYGASKHQGQASAEPALEAESA